MTNLAHEQDYDKPQPTDERKPATEYKLRLSRNPMNYTLANDSRVKPDWVKLKSGRWVAALPGDDCVDIYLPGRIDEDLRRLPTSLDINMAFMLMHRAQQLVGYAKKTRKYRQLERARNEVDWDRRGHRDSDSRPGEIKDVEIDIASCGRILTVLGLPDNGTYRDRVINSLHYLAAVSIRFYKWHLPKPIGKKDITLPPPIVKLDLSDGIKLTFSGEWLARNSDYWMKVPLPLPYDAATQNLVLMALTSTVAKVTEDYEVKFLCEEATLCRKIGLIHHNRIKALARTRHKAEAWFRKHRGDFFSFTRDNRVVIALSMGTKA